MICKVEWINSANIKDEKQIQVISYLQEYKKKGRIRIVFVVCHHYQSCELRMRKKQQKA